MRENHVIVDTGPLVAFLVENDEHHSWAVDQFKRLPSPFLCCEPVLTEAYYLLHRLPRGNRKFFELLNSGLLVVDFHMATELRALAALTKKYADLPMSLTDACVVRMAEIHRGATVFTVDHHFRIYRMHGRQIIPAILPDRSSRPPR